MKKLTEEWLNAAQDDLNVITKIIDEISLSHIVAFHAQQCIEKAFKALMEEQEISALNIHNLVTLYARIEDFMSADLDLSLLKTLDSLYIEARYPGELGLLPNGRPSLDDAKIFADFASRTYSFVRSALSAPGI